MKYFLVILALLFSVAANAQHRGGYYGGYRGGYHGGWGVPLLPLIVGGAVVYGLTQPSTVYAQPYPPYVQPGQTPVYAEVTEYNPACSCYVKVMRQVGWR